MDAPLNSPAPPTPRRALLITALAPVVPQLLGSAFNIWYNAVVVDPLLATAELKQRFIATVIAYNVVAYPVAVFVWIKLVQALRPVIVSLAAGEPVSDAKLLAARCRVIHLPWWGALVASATWLLCIPVFLGALAQVPGPLDPMITWHLPVSFVISACIAVSQSVFLVELASHWALFPLLFHGARADRTPGATALSLRGRGLLWAISAGVCPISSLILLSFAPPAPETNPQWFAVFVGIVGIGFGLSTALMISRLVAQPVDQLRAAAQTVSQGHLEVEVPLRRADEFGVLIGEFNHMVHELREKERLRQTFGLHVGHAAAEQILARDPGLGGVQEIVTVMFVDIRSFTRRSASGPPDEIVRVLNEFLRVMVQVVEERHGGMINKFLGDGFMALFGVGRALEFHADAAVQAGRDMLAALGPLNAQLAREGIAPLEIGIGIHTGPAIVGSIGSPHRLEFTAIGSTVNLASRVEALTKTLGQPMLFTAATCALLRDPTGKRELPPQEVRGVEGAVRVFAWTTDHETGGLRDAAASGLC